MPLQATFALLVFVIGGGAYYFLHIRPALEANLAAKGVVVTHVRELQGRPDLRVQFPSRQSQADFAEAIESLARIGQVVELSLERATVTDLTPLAGLTAVRSLDLSSAQVDDIAPLARLTGLKSLNLSRTHLVAIAPLAGLKAWRRSIFRGHRSLLSLRWPA